MKNKILILNGPNLNLLGKREPEIYGYDTLSDIKSLCMKEAENLGYIVDFRQSNFEGEIINYIQETLIDQNFCALIINAAAYTHTSIAILDALKMIEIPIIEVHLSNTLKREGFRSNSYISLAATGIIQGFGAYSYIAAIHALHNYL